MGISISFLVFKGLSKEKGVGLTIEEITAISCVALFILWDWTILVARARYWSYLGNTMVSGIVVFVGS